jgi:hypothetical protein
VESGVIASYLDERLSLLQSSLLQRIAGMENANATSSLQRPPQDRGAFGASAAARGAYLPPDN